jgi:hypothetical protein
MCLLEGNNAVRKAMSRASPPRVQMAYANSKRNYHVGRR